MITLHMPPSYQGLPCLSPFGTKVATYLRMVGLPYNTGPGDPRKNPKGKIPWIVDDGVFVSDSSDIIDHLKARHGDPLDADLTPAQRALAHTTRRTIEEHLYWVGVYSRWVEDEGFAALGEYFKKILPPVIGPLLLRRVIRPSTKKALYAQGLGRHSRDDIYRRGREDLAAVAQLLGENDYFLGPNPTSIDATLFAFSAAILRTPGDRPIKQVVSSYPNLVAYTDRMFARYFAEDAAT